MTNEDLQDQNAMPLGANAFNQEQNMQSVSNEEESCYGKPDRYDYSGVELPENYCYDENLLNEFNELASKYNLSQKSADSLMSMAVKLTQHMGNNYAQAMAEQQRQQTEEYKHELLNDRELGGVNFERTMKTANIAYTQFANDEVQALLAKTGLNCHPQIVRMFWNIGKRMQNDSVYGVNIAAAPKENREDILFPTM